MDLRHIRACDLDAYHAAVARGWTIHFDPPPIPLRSFDFRFYHRDYDADLDGESWSSNGLGGEAGSVSEALEQIAEIEAEHPHFQTEAA